jgi:hypothetical protein
VSELVRRHPDIDWQRVVEEAESVAGRRMLFLGLFLAHDLLGAEIPADIQKRIEGDRIVRSLAGHVRQHLFDWPAESRNVFAASFFHLRAMERLGDKIRYSFRLATTPNPNDWQLVELPTALHFLYYLIRIVRLVVRHGPVFLNKRRSHGSIVGPAINAYRVLRGASVKAAARRGRALRGALTRRAQGYTQRRRP